MSKILDRIKHLLNEKKLSVRKMEIMLGMSNGALHNAIRNDSNSISSIWIERILAQYPEINPKWLLGDEENMYAPQKSTLPEGLQIPYFNIDFSGGFIEMVNDQTMQPSDFIACQGLTNVDYWCNIVGNSMEPTIANGDRIALRQVDGGLSDVQFGQIYAIVTKEGLRTVKRLEKGTQIDTVLLVADNKDHLNQEIKADSIIHLFKVVAHLGTF